MVRAARRARRGAKRMPREFIAGSFERLDAAL
jgi:hypothetical protein